jgi:hypothetical protein
MLYAATVATSSTRARVEVRAQRREQGVANLNIPRHGVGQREHSALKCREGFAHSGSRNAASFASVTPTLRTMGACAANSKGRSIEHRHAQDHHFTDVRRHRTAIADGGQHLLPAIRERCTVEQDLIQQRNVAALRLDRRFKRRKVGARAGNNGRNAGGHGHPPFDLLVFDDRVPLAERLGIVHHERHRRDVALHVAGEVVVRATRDHDRCAGTGQPQAYREVRSQRIVIDIMTR